jgi:predicted nucleic acid-binding protein
VTKYVIDTNLYIDASRSDEAADALSFFQERSLPRMYLHSVVAQELLAGAVRPLVERSLRTRLIQPFESVGRVITPTHESWKRAGQIVVELVRANRLSPVGFARSFVNDCLIAATAREHGFLLVTRNTTDFELIRTVEPFDFAAPWPDAPGG